MMIIMDGTVDAFLYLGSVPWTFFFLVSIDITCVSLSSFDVLFKNRRIRRDVGVVFGTCTDTCTGLEVDDPCNVPGGKTTPWPRKKLFFRSKTMETSEK